jgi:hypothetical protein
MGRLKAAVTASLARREAAGPEGVWATTCRGSEAPAGRLRGRRKRRQRARRSMLALGLFSGEPVNARMVPLGRAEMI